MSETKIINLQLDATFETNDGDEVQLCASIQQQESGSWLTYFYLEYDDGTQSPAQPSFFYSGKTAKEAMAKINNMRLEDYNTILEMLL